MQAWAYMKLQELKSNAKNPRVITDAKLKQLKKTLTEFGDISGIVFNVKTKNLVGGHQRQKILDQALITITKKYSKPTKTGTMAEGFVELKGERYSYREVYWDKNKETAAMIAANKNAGQFDMPALSDLLRGLSELEFDSAIDLELTMFDTEELASLPQPIEVAAHTRAQSDGKDEDDKEPQEPKCRAGEVYRLGTSILKVGDDELHFCDGVISRFEKLTGETARRQKKTIVRKSSKQTQGQVGHA